MWHGTSLALRLELVQASLGLFAHCGGTVSRMFDPRQLLARVAMLIGSLRRFVFPWRSAVSDFGPLAHHVLSGQGTPPQATGDHGVKRHMAQEDKAILGVMPLQSERGGQPRERCHEPRRRDDGPSDGS